MILLLLLPRDDSFRGEDTTTAVAAAPAAAPEEESRWIVRDRGRSLQSTAKDTVLEKMAGRPEGGVRKAGFMVDAAVTVDVAASLAVAGATEEAEAEIYSCVGAAAPPFDESPAAMGLDLDLYGSCFCYSCTTATAATAVTATSPPLLSQGPRAQQSSAGLSLSSGLAGGKGEL